MTIHWNLLEKQPSEAEKRRWRIECGYANTHGDECSGYIGGNGDPYIFCQVCDKHFTWGDA